MHSSGSHIAWVTGPISSTLAIVIGLTCNSHSPAWAAMAARLQMGWLAHGYTYAFTTGARLTQAPGHEFGMSVD